MTFARDILIAAKEVFKDDNPYEFEKWKRGRPSKEQKERRKLYFDWITKDRKEHPEKYPMVSFLLKDYLNAEVPIAKTVDGKIMIKYKPR